MDREVARLKLESLGISIDTMTPEQLAYAAPTYYGMAVAIVS